MSPRCLTPFVGAVSIAQGIAGVKRREIRSGSPLCWQGAAGLRVVKDESLWANGIVRLIVAEKR